MKWEPMGSAKEPVTAFPSPVEITVCSNCGLPWDDHRLLVDRWIERMREDAEDERFSRDVDATDCVTLLLRANEGPVGPVGPMGATGAACDRQHVPEAWK